jgi:hypothetical protein
MRLLLRIFRFCNPQRKLRKPSTNNVYSPSGANYKRMFVNFIMPALLNCLNIQFLFSNNEIFYDMFITQMHKLSYILLIFLKYQFSKN